MSEAAEEGIEEAAKAIEGAGKRNVEIQDAAPEAASKKGAKKRDPSRRGLATGKQAEIPVVEEEEPEPS